MTERNEHGHCAKCNGSGLIAAPGGLPFCCTCELGKDLIATKMRMLREEQARREEFRKKLEDLGV